MSLNLYYIYFIDIFSSYTYRFSVALKITIICIFEKIYPFFKEKSKW